MSNTPKDSPDNPTPEIKPIQAPAGLDLHPTPQTSVRVSKRAGAAIGLVAIGLLLAFAYGGYRRQIRAQAAEHDSSLPKAVQPATASATEVEKDIPSGNATLARNNPNQLQPPDAGKSAPLASSCGFDPRTGQPYRFNPETGQACAGYPQDRVVVRQPAAPRAQTAQTPAEPTPEERRIAAAYQREQDAMIAPTGIRSGGGFASGTFSNTGLNEPGNDDLAKVAALSQAIAGDRLPRLLSTQPPS